MTDLEELYQDLIVDHFKNPRNWGELPEPSAECQANNPLCGDQVNLDIGVEGGKVSAIRFLGKGCAISQASTSMMGEACEGLTLAEASERVEIFTQMMKADVEEAELVKLGDAASLQGVKKFAARIRCAMLGWEALKKCLADAQDTENN